MRWEEFTFIFLLAVSGTNAQFGEIASLATSLLGGALGNGAGIGALAGAGAAGAGAAGQAGGALAQIGQLYQLAQGALQLTGTGVGVLNQASEGNWFPAVLEQTAKNSQALMKQGGGNGLNLGALGPAPGKSSGLGPEFGTSFPAPNIDDYDENAEIPGVTEKKTPKAPDGLVDIEDEDYEIETTKATTTTTHAPTTTTTEFVVPDEDEEETTTEPTTPPPRQIRIQLPDKDGKSDPEEELDYEDLINKNTEKGQQVIPTIDAESTEELKRNIIATHGTKTQPIVPKLDKLVEVLQKSKLSKEEIDEIVAQVEGNRHIEKPAKYDFNAAVQNIPDKKNTIRQKITDASRIINTNFENQRKEQSFVIQKQVDEFKVLPDLTDSSIAPILLTTPTTTTTTTTTTAPTTTTTPITTTTTTTIKITPASTSKPLPLTTEPSKHVQQTRSVPAAPTQPIPVPQQVVQPAVAAPVAPPVQPPQQPFNNFLYPHNHLQQPFQQQQFYYTQAPFYGQQTQNYWGQQQNQFNQQYGLQQPFQQSQQQQQYYSTPFPTQQPHQQQVQQPHPQQVQQPQQPQQQFYSQQYVPQQQVQRPQPPPQQPQQYHQQPQYPQRQQAPAPVQQRPPSQQVVYRQGSAQPTASPPRPAYSQPNANQVVHYYNDGKQIVQQIIPKKIAANGNLPLSGPFQSQGGASTDPVEYQRRQRALQHAYHQPQTRAVVETQGHARIAQPAARVQPRLYESTVTATGHRQAHAIRTYQATKSASVTPPNPQPAAATRSSGRVSSSKKRYSGHVLPGPTIDHRSLLEKRTTAKPRYVRVP